MSCSLDTVTIELAQKLDKSMYGVMANFIRKYSTDDNMIFSKGGSEMVAEYNEKRNDDAVCEVVQTKPFKLEKFMEDVYHYSLTFPAKRRLTRTVEFKLRVGVWKCLVLARHHKAITFDFTTPELFGDKPETCSKVIIQTILLFLEHYKNDKSIDRIVLLFQKKPQFFMEHYILKNSWITLRQKDIPGMRERVENGGFEMNLALLTTSSIKSFVRTYQGSRHLEENRLKRLAKKCELNGDVATTKNQGRFGNRFKKRNLSEKPDHSNASESNNLGTA